MDAFSIAMDAVREVVGKDYVKVNPDDVERLGRCLIPRVKKASAFVYPADVRQLREIVNIARERHLSLWPCAKGRNWGLDPLPRPGKGLSFWFWNG